MEHEKIIKKGNTEYIVRVKLTSHRLNEFQWDFYVHYREKPKRNWIGLPDTLSDWEYRKLSMEDREIHRKENTLRFLSKEEIYQVKLEFWEKLKPTL